MFQAGEVREGDTLLKIENVHMYFGRVAALAGVDLDVKKGRFTPSSARTVQEKP
jgi:branched-chain amino acid transport system ATP-binding protein